MTDHEVQIWMLIATVVVAGGTLVAAIASAIAAWIAKGAASAWRDGLKQQRADECVSAIEDCAAAIGRSITLKEQQMIGNPGGFYIEDAWNKWSIFRSRAKVLGIYYKTPFDDLVADGVGIMDHLSSFISEANPMPSSGDRINIEFGGLKDKLLDRLKG